MFDGEDVPAQFQVLSDTVVVDVVGDEIRQGTDMVPVAVFDKFLGVVGQAVEGPR